MIIYFFKQWLLIRSLLLIWTQYVMKKERFVNDIQSDLRNEDDIFSSLVFFLHRSIVKTSHVCMHTCLLYRSSSTGSADWQIVGVTAHQDGPQARYRAQLVKTRDIVRSHSYVRDTMAEFSLVKRLFNEDN